MFKKITSICLALIISILFIPFAVTADTEETDMNLVKDPGFENGLVDNYFNGWKNYNTTETEETATSVIISSDQAGYKASPNGGSYVCMTDSTSKTAQVQHYITMDEKTTNRYYEFSTWYRYSLTDAEIKANAVNAKVMIRVRIGSEVYAYLTLPLNATGGEWVKASTVFFVPSGTTNIILDLVTGKISDNSSICYDGVSVKEVSENEVNFLGSAGNMEDTRTVAVANQTVEMPAHIKLFNGYFAAGDLKIGVEGVNYLSVNLSAGETHNGIAGKAFKMVSHGEDAAKNGLSAVLNFQAAAGRADNYKKYDVTKYVLSGYFKTEGAGYARVREEANVIAPNTQHKDDEANAAYYRDTGKLYASGKWEYFEIPVAANIDGHKMQLEYYGTGSVIWDDLALKPYDPMHVRAYEAVYAIDAEGNRQPSGFVGTSVSSSSATTALEGLMLSTASHNGAYALSAVAGSEIALSDLPLEEGETYTLSFWSKLSEEAEADMKATMQIAETAYTCTFPAASTVWKQYVAHFTIPEGTETGTVILSANNADAAFFLDDVSFAKAELWDVSGTYTKDGKVVTTLSGDNITFHGHSMESGTAVTAVYKTVNNVKTLCTLSLSDGSKKVENGWTVPAYMINTVTLPGDSDISVKSFFVSSVSGLNPFGKPFIISPVS